MRANVLTLLVATAVASAASATTSFREWMILHGKEYSPEELEFRELVFNKNLALIDAHNSLMLSWKMGVNAFTGLTGDEFKSQYTSGYRPYTTKSLRSNPSSSSSLTALPTSVDWTTKGAVTKVKNQGGCGSCWSFSATGATEAAHFFQTGKLVSLSEQQLMDCRSGGKGCDGGSPQGAFQFIIDKHGICNDTAYPYIGKDAACKENDCRASATIKSFKEVGRNSESDMLGAVVERPISVAIEADQSSFQHYRSGVMDGACGTKLDHAVLVVGYGTDGGKDYYKIKNSWGDAWGGKGYILLGRGSGFPSTGQCGVQMDGSYPEA